MQNAAHDMELWERGELLLARELSLLPAGRRDELRALLERMGRLKGELVTLSDGAQGSAICAACGGACCRVGRYHPTPLEILAFQVEAETVVTPEFSSSACPFLGVAGCRMASNRRPFTCVIFICDLIEEWLGDDEVVRLNRLEEELRLLREAVSVRFGPRLTGSLLLEMARRDRDVAPLLIPTIDGG